MKLTTGIHTLPQIVEQEGSENTIHPAAVETSEGVLLIDTGYAGHLNQIEAHLEEVGFGWDDVTSILLTHQDSNHAGSLSSVVERTGAVVFAHKQCAPYVDGRKDPIKSSKGERYTAATVDVELVGGVTFQTKAGPMKVVFTPGHAPGHISLYFPQKALLLAADALTVGQGTLQGPTEQYTPNMDEALGSVQHLADLNIEQTLCYHGGYVKSGSNRIDELVNALQ